MPEGGVTQGDLHEALGKQTAIIIATVRRTEDSLKDDISEVKTDVNKDIETVSDRVTHIERRSRYENIFASVLTFFAAYFTTKFTGGS